MKNKSIKMMVIAIGVFVLFVGMIYRNTYIVKNNRIVIKEMSESTQVSDLNTSIDRLNTEHDEYKKYIEKGKAQIAQAITNKGLETAADSSFETMANNIKSIKSTSNLKRTAIFDIDYLQIGNGWISNTSTHTIEKGGVCSIIMFAINRGAMGGNASYNFYLNDIHVKTSMCGANSGDRMNDAFELNVNAGDVIKVEIYSNNGGNGYGYFAQKCLIVETY